MERPIVGFHLDEEEHWVAELSCGHGRHVRHRPPFELRRWVRSEAGRSAQLGALLDCPRCDRAEIPEGFAPQRRTPTFTETTVPAALLDRHDTKPGVWALIHVLHGELEYVVHPPRARREILRPGGPGCVVPEVAHQISPLGEVAFYLEFWRAG